MLAAREVWRPLGRILGKRPSERGGPGECAHVKASTVAARPAGGAHARGKADLARLWPCYSDAAGRAALAGEAATTMGPPAGAPWRADGERGACYGRGTGGDGEGAPGKRPRRTMAGGVHTLTSAATAAPSAAVDGAPRAAGGGASRGCAVKTAATSGRTSARRRAAPTTPGVGRHQPLEAALSEPAGMVRARVRRRAGGGNAAVTSLVLGSAGGNGRGCAAAGGGPSASGTPSRLASWSACQTPAIGEQHRAPELSR